MESPPEIDRPFRFSWDFCFVWLVFFGVAWYGIPRSKGAYSYEHPLKSLLFSLVATFLVYGPVLLARQIVRSGSRGRFVGRVLASILFFIVLAGSVFYFIPYTDARGHLFAFAVAFGATLYLHWRLGSPHDRIL